MRNVALSPDKHRNNYGAVGIMIKNEQIHVKMAKRWPAEKTREMIDDMHHAYNRVHWANTIINQEGSENIITDLRKRGLPVKIITTSKMMKSGKDIEKIKVMDKIEMTEFLRKLKENGQLRFPTNPSHNMKIMEEQIPMFAKHTTEAGGVDYYAPGSEPDDLVRALMMACFSVRNMIDYGFSTGHVLGGVPDNNRLSGRMTEAQQDLLAAFGVY